MRVDAGVSAAEEGCMKPKTRKKKLWRKADASFSRFIRDRDRLCLKCGWTNRQLHCAHIFPRTRAATRYWSLNAITLCGMPCHKWWHENPAESGIWIQDIKGTEFIERLRQRSLIVMKRADAAAAWLAAHP